MEIRQCKTFALHCPLGEWMWLAFRPIGAVRLPSPVGETRPALQALPQGLEAAPEVLGSARFPDPHTPAAGVDVDKRRS